MIELFMRGGPVMLVLLGFSVVSLALILERAFYFIYSYESYYKLLALGRARLARGSKEPLPGRGVLAATLNGFFSEDDPLLAEEAAFVKATKAISQLESRISFLSITGHITPLIGLLGTILGMIQTFAAMEAGGADGGFKLLAGGIWTAMLTTGFGLIIAIPNILAADFFSSVVDKRSKSAELAIVEVKLKGSNS